MNLKAWKLPALGSGWRWARLGLLLAAGIVLALLIPRPVVGTIYINSPIEAASAREVITQIDEARSNPRVRAVVLVLDSPGGTVADTEAVYLELARLRAKKPVVSTIGTMAASGAYYLAVGCDYIFAMPTSQVGNVGVIGSLPPRPSVIEDVASTGPYKLFGGPRDSFLRQLEAVKAGFIQAVSLGRGSRLKLTTEEIARGEIYLGSDALRLGLVDELGGLSQAAANAARRAHVAHYAVADLRELAGLPETAAVPFFYMAQDGRATAYPLEAGLFLLYVPPAEERQP
jgi:protease-4